MPHKKQKILPFYNAHGISLPIPHTNGNKFDLKIGRKSIPDTKTGVKRLQRVIKMWDMYATYEPLLSMHNQWTNKLKDITLHWYPHYILDYETVLNKIFRNFDKAVKKEIEVNGSKKKATKDKVAEKDVGFKSVDDSDIQTMDNILPAIRGTKQSKTGGKFWSVSVKDRFVDITWGRQGSEGVTKRKDYRNISDAIDNAFKRMNEKQQDGYLFARHDYYLGSKFYEKHHKSR
jgi:predicted DNA-binding WGR domain protein